MSEVVAIRTDTINLPEPHEHVIAVKFSDGREASVGEVIEEMERTQEHHTMTGGGEIHVIACPKCDAWPCLFSPVPQPQEPRE